MVLCFDVLLRVVGIDVEFIVDVVVMFVIGVVLVILIVDCLLVVFVVCDGSEIGVVYVGWCGLVDGMFEVMVVVMCMVLL